MPSIISTKNAKIPAADLKRLSRRNGYFWLRDAILDWGVIICTYAAIGFTHSLPLVFPALLIIGNRQHALSLLGHDGTHYTISYNKKWNDFLTNVFTWGPLGLTLSGYRNLHSMHHKDLGTEGDPEIHHKRSRAPQWDLPNKPLMVFKYALLDIVGYSLPDYYIIVTYSKPTSKRSYIPLISLHLATTVAFIVAGLWWVPAIWYGSLLTTFMMFFRLRLWLEHQGTETVHRLHLTALQGALLAPHLSWHHWEHHTWPSVPYHNLPQLRKLIMDEPIITLNQLMDFYRNLPHIPSGTALKKAASISIPQPINSENSRNSKAVA